MAGEFTLVDYLKQRLLGTLVYGNTGPWVNNPNHANPQGPGHNPVRQKFNGYVNFHFNGEIDGSISPLNNKENRVTLSSLIKTSTIPSVEFDTDIKNQYNKKRITMTKADFKPVQMSAYDTVDSSWVMLLMRMYSHLFSNPLSQFEGDIPNNGTAVTHDKVTPKKIPYDVVPDVVQQGGGESNVFGFNNYYTDNNMGLNLQPGNKKYFITHIDIVKFHAQKCIVYTLFNPIVKSFEIDGIDHQSSEATFINMDIEYENFSINPVVNGFIPDEDMERFFKGKSIFDNTVGHKDNYKKARNDKTSLEDEYAGAARVQDKDDPRTNLNLRNQTFSPSMSDKGSKEVSRQITDQDNNFWKTASGSS